MNTSVSSLIGWLLALTHVGLFLLGAPLLSGWVKQVKSRLQGHRGASAMQPLRDLRKLFRKQPVVPVTASPLFRVAPYLVFSSTLLACAVLPLLAVRLPVDAVADVIVMVGFLALGRFFLTLAGLDVGTAFGGMGSSREMLVSSLAEPAMLMAIFTLTMTAHSTNLSTVVDYQLTAGLVLRPSYLFALLALLLVAVAEAGRIPVDNPATHLELTMIHEAMLLEYSGRHLALMEWAAQLKLLFYAVLITTVFLPWGIAGQISPGNLLLALLAVTSKIALLGILLAVGETVLAKMRLFRVPEFLNLALLLALLGMLSSVILESAA